MANIYTTVVWSARMETDEEIALSVRKTFDGLYHLNHDLDKWFSKERPKKGEKIKPRSLEVEFLKDIISKDRAELKFITEEYAEPLENRGVNVGFKSNIDWQKSVGVSFNMGYTQGAICNSCTIDSRGDNHIVEPLNMEHLFAVLKLMVEVLGPDYGFVQGSSFRDSIKPKPNFNINFGWLTYVKDINRVKHLVGDNLSLLDEYYLSLGPGLPPKSCEGMDLDFLMELNSAMDHRK
ncbi:hypothetical protein FEM03_05500 [Phragmitibacter flavus]|uniref:Immunity protein 52 domain-containing protein n=1 Tax=Phragmitibacter flavus TaxID=2576071 RepID=A0A5R8KH11_9BACT|nr:Imm52 family immunity protein [Phragmitibacter flavus]TLD71598.1 hypothetical protein FEM03_05500 [Phragmitibacter flavus]